MPRKKPVLTSESPDEVTPLQRLGRTLSTMRFFHTSDKTPQVTPVIVNTEEKSSSRTQEPQKWPERPLSPIPPMRVG